MTFGAIVDRGVRRVTQAYDRTEEKREARIYLVVGESFEKKNKSDAWPVTGRTEEVRGGARHEQT